MDIFKECIKMAFDATVFTLNGITERSNTWI